MASAPDLSLRGGRRPTWQSREGTYSSYRLPIKRNAPIASVAALTAQPLAALPPYGCGVPFTGSERHAGWQHVPYFFCGARPPDLSLRGGRRPTWRPEREAPLALPLGELSPKVTERALQALPISTGHCSNDTHLRLVIPRSEATWESREGSCDFADSFPIIQPGTARLPRLAAQGSQ